LSYGFGKLGSKGSAPKTTGTGAGTKASDLKLLNSIDTSKMFKLDTNSSFMNFTPGKAYGGMIRGFNNGGGPTDDIPALLMGGEYVMDRGTVRKYGKQYLDSMNSGRAKFAEGGYAGAETETTTESNDSKAKVDATTGTAVNISINVSGGSSSTESQGQTSQGGVDYKKMSERIKAVVLETINEEIDLNEDSRIRVRPSSFVRKDKEGDWIDGYDNLDYQQGESWWASYYSPYQNGFVPIKKKVLKRNKRLVKSQTG
jgi:hypothetical protein